MAVPPSHKKYAAEHYRTVSCRLRVDEYERLKQYTAERGITPSSIILSHIREFIAEEDARRDRED